MHGGGYMYRKKDFLLMEVVNLEGETLGIIENILINFGFNKIMGFLIESSIPFRKEVCISRESILYYNEKMIIKDTNKCDGVYISDIIGRDIINYNSDVLGIVDDVIFGNKFEVEAIVVNSGFLNNIMNGKRIMLMEHLIIGDKNIIYCGNQKIDMFKMPWDILGSVKV